MNESLTFFLAGTITQAITIANTIYYIVQNPAIEKRVRDSLYTNFSTFGDPNASLEQLADELTIESLDLMKDEYLKYCLYEALRIEPPVPVSTSFTITED